jgi:hypothetical protein
MNLVNDTKFLTDGWPPYEEGHVIPNDMTCRMVYVILKMTRSKNILEIGFNYGHSAYVFLNTDTSLKYHSIDICQYDHTAVNANKLIDMYPDRFEFTHMSSHDIDPSKVSHYDMIFIDGDHSIDGMSRDLNLCQQSRPKYILFDDYVGRLSMDEKIDSPNPKRLVQHFLSKPDFPYEIAREFVYPATDRMNHMVLLKREDI